MKKIFLFSLMSVLVAMFANADEARLLRFPTTNGTDVVFSYAGDLYKAPLSGGEAERLTSHIGYEMFARFSPDGKQLAFTGQYDGNTEVYLMSANGGTPKRLTFTSTNSRDDIGDRMGPNNVVMTWSPDGKNIVYRNRISDGFDGKLWTVSVNGGMPTQIPLPEGGFCSYSPDGKLFAYNRVFREFRTWKHYKGGMADDIWIYDPQAKSVTNITNNISQDVMPMWIGDEIFFMSDRDKTMNIFVYNTKTKTTEKVTNYDNYDVRFPSSNGHLIVYENAGYLYKLDPATRQSTKIDISINAEGIYARSTIKHVAKNITYAEAAPDGSRIVATARGEVFDVPVEKGVTRNITRTPGANERQGTWSPDGKYIAYISDRTGETELWLQDNKEGNPVQLTKDNDTYIRTATWSPDSRKIAYTDRKNRVVLVDVASHSKKVLLQDSVGEFPEVAFSPDGQWLTYTKSGKNDMSLVYVYNIATGKQYPITERWYDSSSPVFSSDGKYLVFASARDLNPIYSDVEWNFAYKNMYGVYIALLSKDTKSPFLPDDAQVKVTSDSQNNAKSKAKSDKKDSGEKASAAPSVKIDFDGIADRIVKLPLKADYYGNFYSNGKKVWYENSDGVRVFDLAEQKDESVADGVSMYPTADGKKALFYKQSSGSVYVTDLPSGKADLSKAVDISDMTATVDYAKEWAQIYDEAWRAYRDGFYLENMHGVDWKAMKQKYAVLLPYVKCRVDLNYIIGSLISEMSCGHSYVSPGEYAKAATVKMGLLGAQISHDKSGFFRIDSILPGANYRKELYSPLTEPGMNIKKGDFIVSIDGVPTDSTDNIYSLLAGKAGVLIELGINSTASLAGARKVVVKPIDDEYPLYHYAWVQNNIKTVDKASGGKIGYIYIPDMGPEGLNEFVRYYYPQLDKQALIIDDRGNGGGNISPMVIERLLRFPYRLTMMRGSNKIGTTPMGTQVGPKVLLVNKYSASDGDLFPWSFKATKIGKIIGTRTWGGIIGISGSLPYMDGTDIRVPFFTNYDAKTGKWIVENHGVDPDILLDNDPVKEQMGEDQQLNEAVKVALDELKTRVPLPPVPAPRTLKDLGIQ
jgi:tricorn protease